MLRISRLQKVPRGKGYLLHTFGINAAAARIVPSDPSGPAKLFVTIDVQHAHNHEPVGAMLGVACP